MKFLLDSVISIDHFNDFPPATDYIFILESAVERSILMLTYCYECY